MNRGLYTQNRGSGASEPPSRPREYGGEDRRSAAPAPPEKGGILRSLSKMLPPGIYNPETKKLFGLLTAEDLFLIALILMIADSDDNEDVALLMALVYIFMS